MKRLIKVTCLLLVAVLLASFAVANRHSVRFVVDPFIDREAALTIEAPFYLFLFVALFAGIIMGGVAAWFGQSRWRKLARAGKKEAEIWRRESEKLKRGLQSAPPSSGTPAVRI